MKETIELVSCDKPKCRANSLNETMHTCHVCNMDFCLNDQLIVSFDIGVSVRGSRHVCIKCSERLDNATKPSGRAEEYFNTFLEALLAEEATDGQDD